MAGPAGRGCCLSAGVHQTPRLAGVSVFVKQLFKRTPLALALNWHLLLRCRVRGREAAADSVLACPWVHGRHSSAVSPPVNPSVPVLLSSVRGWCSPQALDRELLTAGGSPVGRQGRSAAAVSDGTVREVAVPGAGRSAGDHGGTVLTWRDKENCHSLRPPARATLTESLEMYKRGTKSL